MTRDEVMALSDEELTDQAAGILGRDAVNDRAAGLFDPAHDIAAAWELVENMSSRRMFPHVYQDFDYGWYCNVVIGGPDDTVTMDDDTSAPRAITRAFVLAMTQEKP